MFTVIIPLYNKKESIVQTINSVLNQTYSNFELVIINDGSTDGSDKLVEGLNDQRIRLINQSNAGVSHARNSGIKEVKFNLIAFLDADDYWEPNYLEEMSKIIQSFPEVGLYGCAFDRVRNKVIFRSDFRLPENYKGIIPNYFRHAVKNHLFSSSSVIINKAVTEKAGFFDERISSGEDLDMWFRIAFYHKVAFYNKVLVHYNLDAENRAMFQKHSLSKSLLHYTAKYAHMEQQNSEFKFFINYYRITMIPKLMLNFQAGKRDITAYLSLIDPTGQSMQYRVFLKLPVILQKIISLMYLKYRRLEA